MSLSFYTSPKEHDVPIDTYAAEGKVIYVSTHNAEPKPTQPVAYNVRTTNDKTILKNSDFDLLARLVTAESKGEPFTGQIAVAEVVLNRMTSEEFPNSLSDVIYQTNQFEPVQNGMINESATESAQQAVTEALNGTNISQGALFFYNKETATSRWLDQFPTIVQIGNHTFK